MSTILGHLRSRATTTPKDVCYRFLRGQDEYVDLTYEELDRAARRLATALRMRADPGDRVLLLLPSGIEFLTSFWACLYAGLIAVPLYPPAVGDRSNKLSNIAADCDPKLAVVEDGCREINVYGASALHLLPYSDLAENASLEDASWPPASASTVAFLQYSSGSTGTPKGVKISHRSMMANLAVIETETGVSGEDTFVGWLPLFHDMGMVMMVLMPVYVGARSVLFSPARFAKNPGLWLRAISDHRGTVSGAPNFAYERCVRGIRADSLKGVDLSSWRLALNGAEPVRASTINIFSQAYSHLGFDPRAMAPAYGMAEATVFMCAGKTDTPTRIIEIAADALELGLAEECRGATSDKAMAVVSCGVPPAAHDMRIVRDDEIQPERVVGEIWMAGESLSSGYWGAPDRSSAAFGALTRDGRGPYFRTGDLGFLADGELFVIGRLSEKLVIHGRNLFPGDLEACARSIVPEAAAGDVAAFSLDENNAEALILIVEVRPRFLPMPFEELAGLLRAALFDSFDVMIEVIEFVAVGAILKTTSGKLMRGEMKKRHRQPGERKPLFISVLKPEFAQERGAPTSDLEIRLAEIWASTLGMAVDDLKLEDNFFALGGQSLQAMKLITEVGTRFGYELSAKDLFVSRTLGAMARTLTLDEAKPLRSSVSLTSTGDHRTAVSLAQQRMWFLSRVEGASGRHNIACALRIDGRLDTTIARHALCASIRRHEPLRTAIRADGEQVTATVLDEVDFELPVADLSGLSAASRHQTLAELVQAFSREPFDLSDGRMIRGRHVWLGPAESVLLLAVHHIAADGWSMGILLREFRSAYQAISANEENDTEPLRFRYSDYARWQRESLTTPQMEHQRSYWVQQLKELPPVHSMPLDRARPPRLRFEGACHRIGIDCTLRDELAALARKRQATLFMVLHAALVVLLSRFGESTDIVVGTPVAARPQPGLENMIGCFVNTLVLRIDASGNPSFDELLEQVKRIDLESQSRQDVPFEDLVDRINPRRSAQYHPLFQIMFNLLGNESPSGRFELGNIDLTVEDNIVSYANFDLTFEARNSQDGLRMDVHYDVDLFDSATIARWAAGYESLLRDIATRSTAPIRELSMVSDREAEAVRDWLDAGTTAYPRNRGVHELFERQAAENPDRTAAVFERESVTYSELDARANDLASRLCRRGVGPGSLVGVHLERSIDMVVALLAILKSGGAYLPLDPTYPQERLRYMLSDARPVVVLTQSSLKSQLAADKSLLMEPHDPEPSPDPAEPVQAREEFDPERIAYVIYTSGSSGQPKGVCVRHRSLTNFICSMQKAPGITSEDVLLATTSLSFDIAALEIYLPLVVGAKLVIASRATTVDPRRLARCCEQHAVTVLQATPSGWRMLLDSACMPDEPRLKALCGGEALTPDLASQLLKATAETWNLYGPTETTVWSTAHRLSAEDVGVPLGRPIANTRLHVLDAYLQPVPLGVSGELHISGDGVARGYLRRDDLSAERFVRDPFGPQGATMYRTGDIVRLRADGRLEYLGRKDKQVKIRGHRIELGEIEERLAMDPGVDVAVVVARPRGQGESDLVAYVSLGSASGVDLEKTESSLKAWVQQALPEFMVPSRIVVVDSWPMTPNGKIDRDALPPAEVAGTAATLSAPKTQVERELAGIWAGLLQIDEMSIGRESVFFDLGGHSLMLVRLIARIDAQFGLHVDIREAFELRTLTQMASFIDDVRCLRQGQYARSTIPNDGLVEFDV